MRVTGQIDIRRPAADVFSYVSDQTNGPAWQQGLDEVRRTTDAAIGVGTKHTFVRRLGSRQVTGENEYVEFEPGGRVVFIFTSSDGLTGRGWYEVDPQDTNQTRLAYGVEIHLQGLMRLASRFIEKSIRKEDAADTRRLKEILERTNMPTNGARQ
jgi:uncharacterized protein YndB with AHSA1/START domain